MTKKTVAQVKSDNLAHFMKRGPALSYAYGTYIVQKDTKNGIVMLGGLGGMGVGQMPWRMRDEYKDYPGWEEAPEVDMSSISDSWQKESFEKEAELLNKKSVLNKENS